MSISNTSNNIKEYCRTVKEEIAQQGKFTIPNLGFLTIQNGKVAFVQTDELDMGAAALPLPPIDTNLKMNANKKLDFSYPSAQRSYRRKKLEIGKFVIPAVVVLLIGIACFVAYKYIAKNQKDDKPNVENEGLPMHPDAAVADTNHSSVAAAPVASNGVNPIYKVAMYSSTIEASATAKATKWKKYGNLTEVDNINGNFTVSILASHPLNDTTLLVDSLRRFFNPKGQVYILK